MMSLKFSQNAKVTSALINRPSSSASCSWWWLWKNGFWTLRWYYKIVYINLPKQFIFLFLSSLLFDYLLSDLLFKFVHFSQVKFVLNAFYKNLSRIVSHVSKWSGDEAAILCRKFLFLLVIFCFKFLFYLWQRKCTKKEFCFNIIWLAILNREELKKENSK